MANDIIKLRLLFFSNDSVRVHICNIYAQAIN
jgi:hypothetical protein